MKEKNKNYYKRSWILDSNKYVILLIVFSCTLFSIACSSIEVIMSTDDTIEIYIEVDYEKVFSTTNTPLYICIDGEKLEEDREKVEQQKAGTNKIYTVNLTKGEHEFSMRNRGIYETDRMKFNVSEDYETFCFGAKTRMTLGVEVWKKG